MSMQSVPTFNHPIPDAAWLSQLEEEVLDPQLPIIDAHHHLWDRLSDRYLLDDFLQDTNSGHNIVATIFAQCAWAYRTSGPEEFRPVGETEFVASVALEAIQRGLRTHVCEAIVGHVDFRLGFGVDEVLQAHISAGGGRFRGIRQVTARHPAFLATILIPPPLGLMADPAFRLGVSRLKLFNLSFDGWLYHPQIGEFSNLARAFPETSMVLNHVGGPLGIGPYMGKRDEVFRSWLASMQELGSCPNVSVKLGGLGMNVCGFAFKDRPSPPNSTTLSDAWRPYIESCILIFGANRCMFESNFPVDKAQCSYQVLWNAFKRIASGASTSERAALFHDTAARIYRLP